MLHRLWGCNVYRRLFHKLVYFLYYQLTLIRTRHRRYRLMNRHPSDFSPLIISFLWRMLLASRKQTAFCDFVTVIGHINLCSHATLAVAARQPQTGRRRRPPTVVACPQSTVRRPLPRRICGCPDCQFFIALCDTNAANLHKRNENTVATSLGESALGEIVLNIRKMY